MIVVVAIFIYIFFFFGYLLPIAGRLRAYVWEGIIFSFFGGGGKGFPLLSFLVLFNLISILQMRVVSLYRNSTTCHAQISP